FGEIGQLVTELEEQLQPVLGGRSAEVLGELGQWGGHSSMVAHCPARPQFGPEFRNPGGYPPVWLSRQRRARWARSMFHRLGLPSPSSMWKWISPVWVFSSSHDPSACCLPRVSSTASPGRGSGVPPT